MKKGSSSRNLCYTLRAVNRKVAYWTAFQALVFGGRISTVTAPSDLPRIPISKRIFDLCLTLPGLVLISPILGIVALLVRLNLGAPVIFRQTRPGFMGRPFVNFKFRTMKDSRDAQGHPLPDNERLTKLWKFLRATSLDELPELFNVLKGEMSLVGPRPLLMQYLERYSPEQRRRQHVLPGMAGWAQINGRNALTWDEKFRLDVWYVDHWSLWLDVRILAITLWKVLKREGINQPGHATAEEFMGNLPLDELPSKKAENQ
jgi:lipopolysaccharide/colanic/teichoic acid biosynthesis glycosyltransferase